MSNDCYTDENLGAEYPGYVHVTYGLGRVYDPELGAWREPVTEDEVWVARRFDEYLKKSFVETDASRGDASGEMNGTG